VATRHFRESKDNEEELMTKQKELGANKKSICHLNTKLAHGKKREELLLK